MKHGIPQFSTSIGWVWPRSLTAFEACCFSPPPPFWRTDVGEGADESFLLGGDATSDYVGDKLLGEILKFLPGSHIERVQLFYFQNEETYRYSAKNRRLPSVHMEVEFTFARSKKRLFYINGHVGPDPLETVQSFKERWWMESLKQLKPQALIVKGQGQGQALRTYDSLYLSWLKEAGGFLLYDKLPADSVLLSPNIESTTFKVDMTKSDDQLAWGFGYEKEASVVKLADP